MSYDFSMYVDVGGDEPGYLGYDANYTYNVAPMFALAFGDEEGIRVLHTKKGRICRGLLKAAITRMEASPEVYEAMNPESGWGNVEGALDLLYQLLGWCTEAPGALMEIT